MEIELKQEVKHKNLYIALLCFAVAFFMLLIGSCNSFLYSFNDWVDVNWYKTVGNGILEGKIPYKDLFEQKGPIIYYAFAFFELFSNSAVPIFLTEVACLTIYLFFMFKIFRRFLSPFMSLASTILLCFITICWLPFLTGGGAIEEYALPIIAYFLLLQQDYFDGKDITTKRAIIVGVLLGILLWSKFTLIIIPAVILIVWLVQNLIKKQFNNTIETLMYMLMGLLIVTIPIIALFIANGAILDLFYVYFYVNLFKYSKKAKVFEDVIAFLLDNVLVLILTIVLIVGLIALMVLLFKKKRNIFLLLLAPISQGIMLLNLETIYLYYLLILMPYFAYVFVLAFYKLDKFKLFKGFEIAICSIAFVSTFSLSFVCGNGVFDLKREKLDYVQYQVAYDIKQLNQDDDYTLFCYNMKDYGFYNACEVVPNEKYFAKNNISKEAFPEMYQAFDAVIINKKCDFVIMLKSDYLEKTNFVSKNYEFVKEYSYTMYENFTDISDLEIVLLAKK